MQIKNCRTRAHDDKKVCPSHSNHDAQLHDADYANPRKREQVEAQSPADRCGEEAVAPDQLVPRDLEVLQSDDSFELQQTILSINESYSHTESSDAHNAEHLQFDKEKFMRLVLTEDWASIF